MPPQLALACAIQSKNTNKELDRGHNFFLEKSQGVRLWQAVSWVCMICSSQPKRFLRQLRLGTFPRSFASCKQFSEIGRPGSSQSFSGARPKLVFWKAWLSRPPGIGDFCCGLLQCRTSLPCNKNNPEITSLTCKRPLRERDEKKA